MNNFKEELKVELAERDEFGRIKITDSLKNLLIELMRGNISKPELMSRTGIGDKTTVELKIKEIVADNPELRPLYEEYSSKKRENFMGYQFRAEAIEMLRKDYSQSFMAKKIGVSVRSFSFRMKRLQEENSDNALGRLLKQHTERKLRKLPITSQEILLINLQLDEYEEKYPVGQSRYEKRDTLEIRKENFQKVVSLVESLRADGLSLSEMEKTGIISGAVYKRYKQELEVLLRLLDDNQEKEQ
jgi:hypothetical protein